MAPGRRVLFTMTTSELPRGRSWPVTSKANGVKPPSCSPSRRPLSQTIARWAAAPNCTNCRAPRAEGAGRVELALVPDRPLVVEQLRAAACSSRPGRSASASGRSRTRPGRICSWRRVLEVAVRARLVAVVEEAVVVGIDDDVPGAVEALPAAPVGEPQRRRRGGGARRPERARQRDQRPEFQASVTSEGPHHLEHEILLGAEILNAAIDQLESGRTSPDAPKRERHFAASPESSPASVCTAGVDGLPTSVDERPRRP